MSMDVKLTLSLIDKLAGPARQARKSLDGLGTAARRIDGQSTRPLANGIARITREARAADIAIANLNKAGATRVSRFKDAMADISGGFGIGMGQGLATGAAFAAVGYGLKLATDRAIDFETAMNGVQRKVEGLNDSAALAAVRETILDLAKDIGTPATVIAKMAEDLGAAGVHAKDLGPALKLVAEAARAFDLNENEAGKRIGQIMAASGRSVEAMRELFDMINMVGDKSSATEAGVVEAFQRIEGGAKAAGVETKALLALLGGMQAAGMAPEVSSTALSAMLTDLASIETATKPQEEALRRLGVTAAEISSAFKANELKGLLDLLDRIKASANPMGNAAGLFGQQWADEVTRLAQARPEVERIYKLLSNPTNYSGGLLANLNSQLTTTQSKLDRVIERTAQAGQKFSEWTIAPALGGALDGILGAFDAIEARQARQEGAAKAAQSILSGRALSPALAKAMTEDPAFEKEVGILLKADMDKRLAARRNRVIDGAAAAGSGTDGTVNGGETAKRAEALRLERGRLEQAIVQADALRLPAKAAEARQALAEFDAAMQARSDKRERSPRVSPDRIKDEQTALILANELGTLIEQLKTRDAILANALPSPARDQLAADRTVLAQKAKNLTASGGGDPASNQVLGAMRADIEALGLDGVKAARAAAEQTKEALAVDAMAAGAAAMASFTAGITAGGDAAIAAATAIAAKVRETLSGAGAGGSASRGRAPGGQFHDGGSSGPMRGGPR